MLQYHIDEFPRGQIHRDRKENSGCQQAWGRGGARTVKGKEF